MKWLMLLLITGCTTTPAPDIRTPPAAMRSAAIVTPPSTITLAWSFPLGAETPDLVFNLYHAFALTDSPTHWPLLRVIPGTERSTQLAASAPQEFFALTASNQFGESGFATHE